MAPVSETATSSAFMDIKCLPRSRVVENVCSQLLFSSAFADDTSAFTLTGDPIEIGELGVRGALREDGELDTDALTGTSYNGRLREG